MQKFRPLAVASAAELLCQLDTELLDTAVINVSGKVNGH